MSAPARRPDPSRATLSRSTLERYLRQHGHRLEGEPQLLTGGLANLNYLIHLDGQPYVLRRPPPGPKAPGAHDMVREHRVLEALATATALTPRVLHLCRDSTILGDPFFIMTYCPGLIIGGELPGELSLQTALGSRLTDSMLSALIKIHRIDAVGVGLGDLGRPDGFLARQVAGWARRADRAFGSELPREVPAIVDWLGACLPANGEAVLLHNDFKLDNLVLDPQSLAPVAVLDWDLCTRGDARFDLAVLLSYWVEPDDPEPVHALAQMPTTHAGFPSRREVLTRYRNATGRSLDDFHFFRVLALLRLAVVFAQLQLQYSTTGDPQLDPAAKGFARLALDLIAFTEQVRRGEID